jgi:beta-mannosidase
MKHLFLKTAIILVMSMIVTNITADNSLVRMNVNTGWKFRQARLNNWYPASIPGTVHTDLLANKIIEDPFYRLNERGMQWIDKEDWIYQTEVSLSGEMLGKENIDIVCLGLDTYADVYLNDSLLMQTDNMFRTWRVNAKKLFHQGKNTLKIYFHSPIKIDMPKWRALPYQYEASNDQSENGGLLDMKLSVFARKAGYHYGWDWGPRLVTSGIWRPIIIEAWSKVRISDLYISQKNVTPTKAEICGKVNVDAAKSDMATITITDARSGKPYARKSVMLTRGANCINLPFDISKPKLWWTNGLGAQNIYQFVATVKCDGKMIDSRVVNTGIRSLKIIHKPDKEGHTFYVELNGRPVFMKGADYIPQDNFLPRVSDTQYSKLINAARDCNMNMLRVWGGGIYENDIFYQKCDEAGILIWQDFMFACSLYPAEGSLLENIRQEAIDNVCRLRNHPCIALWCGNNECNDGWYNWGWRKKHEKENHEWAAKIKKQYDDTYYDVLPSVVKEYAPETFYWPSSPFATREAGSGTTDGDTHYWGVWHGKEPIENFNKVHGRFFSEYGFQSFPDMESVMRYAPDSIDHNIYSEVMMSHQRGGSHANGLIETYLLNEYKKPMDFEQFLYVNQVLQADAIKTAIEAHRRDMPHCMGTLFWQIDDCWPVASWSSIDYYGRWKALQYFSKKAYRDILVSPIVSEDGKTLHIYVVSDRKEEWKNAALQVSFVDMNGKIVSDRGETITISPNASRSYMDIDLNEYLNGHVKSDVIIVANLKNDNGKGENSTLYENYYELLKQKDMNYPNDVKIDYTITPANSGYNMTLTANRFARAVCVMTGDADAVLSDNYMDILPGQKYTIRINTTLTTEKLKKQIKILHYGD